MEKSKKGFLSKFLYWVEKGGNALQAMNIGLIPLLILFVVLSGFINMFLGNASAKWAIMGPVFIPMFMNLGYSPELSHSLFSYFREKNN